MGLDRQNLRDQLIEYTRAADLTVDLVSHRAGNDAWNTSSGICRLHSKVRVLLIAQDPIDDQIAVLIDALRLHGQSWIDDHYLPPAIRACLEN